MVKNKSKQNKNNVRAPPRPPNPASKTFIYRRIRDPVVTNAAIGTSAIAVLTDGAGVYNAAWDFSAFGITGFELTSTSVGTALAYSTTTYAAPYLPWLYHTSASFQEYRILAATFIVKPILGSNTTGVAAIVSDVDTGDSIEFGLDLGNAVGGTIGPLKQNEIRHVCNVDTAWKKVSAPLAYTSDGNTTSNMIIANTANDQIFCAVSLNVTSAAVSSTVARVFMEYDVEFRKPKAPTNNA